MRHEPVAVVGQAIRCPRATNAAELWCRLLAGTDAVGEVPMDRWDVEAYFDPDPDAPGKTYSRHGGFLESIDQFDASFFGISPRVAGKMDPQQRMLLEASWEALEDAGIPPESLMESRTGLFMGMSTCDYRELSGNQGLAEIDAYTATGVAFSAGVGRISHTLGLTGPCLAIDTACSSSLVAVSQACESLAAGSCDLALAGGVNVMASPALTIALSKARMLAPDGKCKTFDARADGYVRGEGSGVVVLKRLSDAEQNDDRILAVIRGSAVNHAGHSAGLTVPSRAAQAKVIQAALEQAGLAPHEIDYLEAHGTGTALGDPIEVLAAADALGRGRERSRPLWIGSIKTNIGHLEAAAGIAGMIKVVLALGQGVIPRHLHCETPSPRIPWGHVPVKVARENIDWPSNGRPRTAGVSAFGFAGTNAHVVLEEAPS
jgi:acyl transferase domain-containing protein